MLSLADCVVHAFSFWAPYFGFCVIRDLGVRKSWSNVPSPKGAKGYLSILFLILFFLLVLVDLYWFWSHVYVWIFIDWYHVYLCFCCAAWLLLLSVLMPVSLVVATAKSMQCSPQMFTFSHWTTWFTCWLYFPLYCFAVTLGTRKTCSEHLDLWALCLLKCSLSNSSTQLQTAPRNDYQTSLVNLCNVMECKRIACSFLIRKGSTLTFTWNEILKIITWWT